MSEDAHTLDGTRSLAIAGPLGGGNDGIGRRTEDDPNLAVVSALVRRLTPVECERLQGFPDGWTIPEGPSLAEELSHPLRVDESCPKPDSPRYAACGDAVTVNVSEWIGRQLMAELKARRELEAV